MSRRTLVSGSTGFIGTALVTARRAAGDTVVPLVRGPAGPAAVSWDELTPAAVAGFDAVVHLSGEPITGRWTDAKRRAMRESRIGTTARLAAALAVDPPDVFISASGINYYGDRGPAIVDESDRPGAGFLAEASAEWEAAAAPLAGRCRVVHLRLGMVLARDGGPLQTMLPTFRLGLGGPIAGGWRYVSWVTLHDAVRAIGHAITSPTLAGPVNVVAPRPATNREFTRALAAALGRPAVVPVPGWLVRLIVGPLAEETALTSLRAVPAKLTADGFGFDDPAIGSAMTQLFRN